MHRTVLFVLMICYTLSFIDRQILSLLVGPIKRDLGLSDTRVGLLQGLAFALFYGSLGIPIGKIADMRRRTTLITIGVLFWSVMTTLCAGARSFGSLFLARMGVGVGEATLAPGAFSLITDYFSRERLARALSVDRWASSSVRVSHFSWVARWYKQLRECQRWTCQSSASWRHGV